jgi:mRNA-degrading endonuclease YafQ of YafQ-DinJ toxin-antitoxin module
MYQVNQTPYFLKKAKKVIKKNFDMAKQVDKTIQTMQKDPFQPSLKTHKVRTPRFDECFSSSVNGDIRII